jgi:glycosyltransferase involved in cell wall biosynthesis
MPPRLRVLHVIPAFAPAWSYGGPVRVTSDLVRELAKLGHEVSVFTTNALLPFGHPARKELHYATTWEGVNVHYFALPFRPFSEKQRIFYSLALRRYLKNYVQDFDLVHLHEYWTWLSVDMLRWAVTHGIPVALSAHGGLVPVGQRHTAKAAFDRIYGDKFRSMVTAWVSVSPLESRHYRHAGIPDNQIVELPNGIDGEMLHPDDLVKRNNEVLYVGRLHKDKGIETLITAFKRVQHEIPDAILRIVGPDDGALASLRNLVSRLQLKPKVRFTGTLTGQEKVKAYQRASAVAYLSRYEIFGLVPFEALMCGTPVVTTRDTGCGEMLRTYDAVQLVPYGNVSETTFALLKILNSPHLECRALNDATRARLEFGLPRRTREYEQYFAKLLAKRLPTQPALPKVG